MRVYITRRCFRDEIFPNRTCFSEAQTSAMEASGVQVHVANRCLKKFLHLSVIFMVTIAVTIGGVLIYDKVSF